MSGAQYKKLHFDDELRELLRQASIDTQVPAPLPQLQQNQQQR